MSSAETLTHLVTQNDFEYIATNYVHALTIIAGYDIVITLGDEVDLVWHRNWRWINLLYFANRYVPLVQAILCIVSAFDLSLAQDTALTLVLFVYIFAPPIVIAITQGLMTCRVCLLYHDNRFVTAGLWSLLASCSNVNIALAIMARENETLMFDVTLSTTSTATYLLSNKTGCMLQISIWSLALLVDTVLVVLTTAKTYSHVRAAPQGAPVLALVLRDGCLYFVAILFLMVANIICLSLGSTAANYYMTIFVPPELCISAVLCSRLFLNLRAQVYRTQDTDSSVLESSGGEIQPHSRAHEITDWSLAA